MGKAITFKLQGGTGNQLFIYFAALLGKLQSGEEVRLDISCLQLAKTKRANVLDSFNLPCHIPVVHSSPLWRFFIRILKKLRREGLTIKAPFLYAPTEVGFCSDFLPSIKSKKYVDGYFQTWKFLDAVRAEFPEWNFDLRLKSDNLKYFLNLMSIENPIVVHVRRGDYLEHFESFGILDEKYFSNGIEALLSEKEQVVWLFSDDPKYVQETFKLLKIDRYPELERVLSQEESLYLMSRSSKIIISNSTFSWWAASLASPDTTIIAPLPWFKALETPQDLIPKKWEIVPSVWKCDP